MHNKIWDLILAVLVAVVSFGAAFVMWKAEIAPLFPLTLVAAAALSVPLYFLRSFLPGALVSPADVVFLKSETGEEYRPLPGWAKVVEQSNHFRGRTHSDGAQSDLIDVWLPRNVRRVLLEHRRGLGYVFLEVRSARGEKIKYGKRMWVAERRPGHPDYTLSM